MITYRKISSIADTLTLMVQTGLLSKKRYDHIMRVEALMSRLASRFSVAQPDASIAALTHDMDRDRNYGYVLGLCADWGVSLSTLERSNPVLVHGALTAARLQYQFGIRSTQVLHAVRHHTLGNRRLDRLGLLLFVSDYCEPCRQYLNKAERECILGQDTPEHMALLVLRNTKRYFKVLVQPSQELYIRLKGEIYEQQDI